MIRKAENKDVPRLMELLREVLEVHHQGRPDLFKSNAAKYTPKELKRILAAKDTPVFVYTDKNDRVLGYVFCIIKQPDKEDNIMTAVKTLYIDDLCISSAHRGEGIGRSLYEYAAAYAEEIGCYNLTLNVWALNDKAKGFYEKMGLVPQKYHMEKVLRANG